MDVPDHVLTPFDDTPLSPSNRKSNNGVLVVISIIIFHFQNNMIHVK